MVRLCAFLCLVAAPAAASDICHDLWFTRNLIMDRAGYCFGSALGQAVFDNSGCVGKSVALDSRSARLVGQIQTLEAGQGCRVDTKRGFLDLDDRLIRQRLWDLPIRDEFESACLGWLGPVTPLLAGHDQSALAVGRIQPGDYISYEHVPVGVWTYVTARTPDWQIKSGGWLNTAAVAENCVDYAG